MEKDDELKGEGNSYYTHFRLLDPRIGRWMSIDPEAKEYPDESPYTAMENNPITENDPDGDCPWCIAFVKGAVQEYATQVITNIAEGKDWKRSLTEVDGMEIVKAGAIDAVTLGLGSLVKKGTAAIRIAHAASNAKKIEAAEVKVIKVEKVVEKVAKAEKNVLKAEKAIVKSEKALVKGEKALVKNEQNVAKKLNNNSVNSTRPTEKYTITDSKGKTYHGVGDVEGKRAQQSLKKLEKNNPTETFQKTESKVFENRKGALIEEQKGIDASGGAKSPNNYNAINSPGKKL